MFRTETMTAGHKDYTNVRTLYENAFPPEERIPIRYLENGHQGNGDFIAFYQGDLFAALPAEASGSCPGFDIITANPPYIPTAVIRTLQPEVRDHEPVLALDGSGDGVYYYRRIAAKARDYLTDRGRLYLEIGHDQGDVVSGILDSHGYRNIRVVKDLPGNDRVVCAAI